jgi:hypothetical protein
MEFPQIKPYDCREIILKGVRPTAVLARAGPALRPGGGRRIEDSLSLKPELDRFVEEETGRGIEVATPASKSRGDR